MHPPASSALPRHGVRSSADGRHVCACIGPGLPMWRWFHWMKLISVVVHDSHEADSSPDSTDCDLVNDLLDGTEKARRAPCWPCQTLGSARLTKSPVRAESRSSRTTPDSTGGSPQSAVLVRGHCILPLSAGAPKGCPAAKSMTGVGRGGLIPGGCDLTWTRYTDNSQKNGWSSLKKGPYAQVLLMCLLVDQV